MKPAVRNRAKPIGTLLYTVPPKLPGSPVGDGRVAFCSRCLRTTAAQGGVDLTATRWCCASCWKSCTAGSNPSVSRRRLFASAATDQS